MRLDKGHRPSAERKLDLRATEWPDCQLDRLSRPQAKACVKIRSDSRTLAVVLLNELYSTKVDRKQPARSAVLLARLTELAASTEHRPSRQHTKDKPSIRSNHATLAVVVFDE